jgi:class II lanthipeptide synthase
MCSESAYLAAASAIGQGIVEEAVWHDRRCTWIGATTDPKEPWRLKYRALGPRAYEGTAGVGLFLAQLAGATGEAAARRTAVGALRHALDRAPELPPIDRDGLYAGVIGVVLAVARAAIWLDEPELDSGARELMAASVLPAGTRRCPDVMMGSAGAIIGLIALAEIWGDRELIHPALETGEQLLARATVTRNGWTWRRARVCGLAHGAGGIGWALLELFAATGAERFRAAATGAFAYERSWLDPTTGTWPDLRIPGQRRGKPRIADAPTSGVWCRGEAGIAQTRLRALALADADPERRDATYALDTTRRHVAGLLDSEIVDLSLCHGAAGACDVLLSAAGPTPEAVALGQLALERHFAGSEPWPCGVAGGTTPGLFLGHSGIGWWLLRLHDGRLPSPLGIWG